jgi:predicted helicase
MYEVGFTYPKPIYNINNLQMSFDKILAKYSKYAFSERDKGDRFERLMQAYLQTDPKYAPKFKKVWLWSEFPGKTDLGGSDVGIDLVALTLEGDYWAIQCKCYREGAIIDKPTVDTFLSTSSRQFKNEDLKTVSFSNRLWIDTTGRKWGSNAEEAIRNQHPPVSRLNLFELKESPVNWEKLEQGIHGEASRAAKKPVFPHIHEVRKKTQEYYKSQARGKLIMACGTGKTIASLKIAEDLTDGKGLILFLVPSISLLGQSLREWSAQADEVINAICICSDSAVTQKRNKNEDTDNISVVDLALPASTEVKNIVKQFHQLRGKRKPGMTVVFSTYQSIDVISKTQKELKKTSETEGLFDLIICDEAHRTTGVSLSGEEESAFIKVHDNNFLEAKKRLYMTATPRLYNDESKSKAAQAEAVLCSMDDEVLYGGEIYRIGFGEAVERDLLTDYKVLILTLSDKDVPPAIQRMIANYAQVKRLNDIFKLRWYDQLRYEGQKTRKQCELIQEHKIPVKNIIFSVCTASSVQEILGILQSLQLFWILKDPENKKLNHRQRKNPDQDYKDAGIIERFNEHSWEDLITSLVHSKQKKRKKSAPGSAP